MKLISDSKEPCLYWYTTLSGARVAYFRKMIRGHAHQRSLGEIAPADAREVARKLRREVSLDDLTVRLGFASRRSDLSTLGAVFAAYEAYCRGIVIGERTVIENMGSLKRIVRTVHGGGFDVDAARVSVFDAALLREFSARMLAARKAECGALPAEEARARIDSAQRTIKSTVQQARSLFARGALQSSAYAKLVLPEREQMDALMQLKLGMSTLKAYDPPAPEVVARITGDAAALKGENLGMWRALNLEGNGGLRRGSAVAARWDWFVDAGADAEGARIVYLCVNVAKGGRSKVRFDAGASAELLATKKEGEVFVLPGETPEAREAVCVSLVDWLKARGLNRRQPNHEMRKLFGDKMYSTHGATETQRALGQSTPVLASKVYAEARSSKAVRVL